MQQIARRTFLAGSAGTAMVTVPALVSAASLPEPDLLRRYHAFLSMEAHALRVLTQQEPSQDPAVLRTFYDRAGDSLVPRPWTNAAARAPTVLTAAGIPVN